MIRTVVPLLILAIAFTVPYRTVESFSVAEKARAKRLEVISYLREMRPMVFNFPCEPFPDCNADADNDGEAVDLKKRVKDYNQIKRVYQEGLVYFFEGSYVNAYNRFLDSQRRTQNLLEEVSQSYLDRTEHMLRDAIEQKTPDSEEDLSIVDISVEYGPSSRLRKDFDEDRESPNEERRYNPRLHHYMINKYHIEANMEKGYKQLGLARKVREKAIMVDSGLPKHRKTTPDHIKKRIEFFLASIRLARHAKSNAYFIFQHKYPYDNYALQNPNGKTETRDENVGNIPTLDGKQMIWTENPYLSLKKLHPIFDLRLPDKYRRDAIDIRSEVYTEEVNQNVKFKYHKKKPESLQDAPNG